jgi:hypothetical protein
MMISIKNKTAYALCAAQEFEPSTLRLKACLLPKQTTRPPTVLAAHIDFVKNQKYIP